MAVAAPELITETPVFYFVAVHTQRSIITTEQRLLLWVQRDRGERESNDLFNGFE